MKLIEEASGRRGVEIERRSLQKQRAFGLRKCDKT